MNDRSYYINKAMAILICFPALLDALNTFIKAYTGLSTSSITFFLYAIVLLCCLSLSKKGRTFTYSNAARYLLLLFPFLICYLLFPVGRKWYFSQEMLSIYCFFLVVCVFIVKNIVNLEGLINAISIPAGIVSILCLSMLTIYDYQHYLNYMEFSYSLLPISAFLYLCIKKDIKRKWSIICFCVSIICTLTCGARSPLVFIVIFIALTEIFIKENTTLGVVKIGIVTGLVILTLFLFRNEITAFIRLKATSTGSYVLMRLAKGNFWESSTRNNIYDFCKSYISNMGLSINGPFFDRYLLGNNHSMTSYPHNFVYEVLIDFGWIVGLVILIGFFGYLIKLYFEMRKDEYGILIFNLVIICYFARYVVSGSFLIERQFYMGFALLVALKKRKRMERLM